MDVDENNLDGWSIPREAFEWIYNNLDFGSTILELGSGNGTKELVKHYKVFSVEEDEKWVGLVPESKYIYSPLKRYDSFFWYDDKYLDNIPEDYDLLIIDGPIGNNRENFIHFNNLFRKDIPYVIDDTNRPRDKGMALHIAESLKKEVIEIKGWQKEVMVLI